MKSTLTYLAAVVAFTVTPAQAAEPMKLGWPAKQITWVVGYVPGGTVDVLTRIAAQQLAPKIDVPVVVENRPGASGAIALQLVARSRASDGYLITVPGPVMYTRPQPEIGKQLAPVMLLAQGPMVVVGAKDGPSTLKDLLSNAQKQPEKWSYASSGNGTSQHLAGELLNEMAKTKIVHVPYKGGAQAATDVVGGQIPVAVLGPTPVLAHIKSGAMKAYAVTGKKRLDALPDVPTLEQAGLPGYEATQWFAAAAGPQIPPQALAQVNKLLNEIVHSTDFKKAATVAGMDIGSGSQGDLVKFIESDTARWNDLVKRRKLTLTE